LQQCGLLRQVNERQVYWYQRRCSNKYRPIPIPTDNGEYRPIPNTGIGLTLTAKDVLLFLVKHSGGRDPSLTLTQFCARLKTVILQSIRNTSIVPTWQFRL